MWFLSYVHGLVLLWNLGVRPPIGAALAPGLAAVLYASGALVERAEPNWIAGVRTRGRSTRTQSGSGPTAAPRSR